MGGATTDTPLVGPRRTRL